MIVERGRALHPKSNIIRIYIKGKYGRRRLISVGEYYPADLRNTDNQLAISDEIWLKVEKSIRNRIEQENIYGFIGMHLHRQFGRDTDNKN